MTTPIKKVRSKTRRKKCKCKCHIPEINKYGGETKGKKIGAHLCSDCMENHKRSKYYQGLKMFQEGFKQLF